MTFHFRLFPEKTNDKIFQKMQKLLLLAYFLAKKIFPQNSVLTSQCFSILTSIIVPNNNKKKKKKKKRLMSEFKATQH